jgi:adenylate kinase
VNSGHHLILMGAQGAGKGTQAERLAPELNLYHLSTGEAFRAAISAQTELGVLAKSYLDRGDLVPDDVTLGIVAAKLDQISSEHGPDRKAGALFDGFPRTLSQAEGLTDELQRRDEKITAVVEIVVPRADLVARLSGRRVCPVDGAVYHVLFNPPKVEGICDKDGALLIQREDDTPEAIERRLNLFDEMTAPVLAYYRTRGLLASVDGTKSIDDVHADIRNIVAARMTALSQ